MIRSNLIAFLFLLLSCSLFAQDTTVIKTFNYGSTTRDTVIDFPDGSESYEKIIMAYAMRCKNALVSDGTNRNKGCGEWDYSCNTYIEDPSKTDSLRASTADFSISKFSGTSFNYRDAPMFNYYRNRLQKVTVNSSSSTTTSQIGGVAISRPSIIPTSDQISSGFAGKSQYLYTASELLAAGVTPGDINAFIVKASGVESVKNVQIRVKSTTEDSLSYNQINLIGFTSVFYDDVDFVQGSNEMHFHTPFNWDGVSNLIIEFSTNSPSSKAFNLECTPAEPTKSLIAFSGSSLNFDGVSTYVEANDYKGILGANDRTIDAWIKTSAVNGEICSWGINSTSQKWVFRVNGDGTLRTEVNGGGVNGTTVVNDNKWHHVVCVFSGSNVSQVKHYVDGKLEVNGAVTSVAVNTQSGESVRISKGINNRYFNGSIDEVKIWDVALSADEVATMFNKRVALDDARIKLRYQFDERNADVVLGTSNDENQGKIMGSFSYNSVRGVSISRDFFSPGVRPDLGVVQGVFDLTIKEEINYDSVQQLAHNVIAYNIESRVNTNMDDEKVEVNNSMKWNADNKEYFFDESSELYDSASLTADGTITPQQVEYMRRWPSRLEIMSFVTPYGIGLDLGREGKVWMFDVTDFTPILKGSKRIFLSRGGQNQEEMDIQFLFVKGTPAREVLDIAQIWPTQQYSANYTQIQQNTTYFPPVEFKALDSAKAFKIRSAITGHGQQGEFIPRTHIITAGDTSFARSVWKTCGDNPVYPQGGTWIYDRAGWCPGMATDVAEYDISKKLKGGEKITLDYDINNGSGDSRYIVNNQIVSYGERNFGYDLAVENVLRPSNNVEFARSNPTCLGPVITVRNNGKNTVYGITVDYWVNDKSNKRTGKWKCDLKPGQLETIYLPQDNSIYTTSTQTNNTFFAEVVAIDGNTSADEYAQNNVVASSFDFPEFYPKNIVLYYQTNGVGAETKVKLTDEWGKVILNKSNLSSFTTYRDTLHLGLGCYKLTVEDTDGDGLRFFANNDGNGSFRIWEEGGFILKTLNADFGNKTELNFTIVNQLDVPKRELDLGYSLYPNPTNGLVTISGGDMQGATHQLFNSFGQRIEAPHDLSNDARLTYNLSTYPSGIYFIKIQKNGYSWLGKVIVE